MRHECKFAARIRSGGNSVLILPLNPVRAPEVKFSLVPDWLLDRIIDDALAAGVARLNGFLPEGVSIDIPSVDLAMIRDELRAAVADRLGETGVPVNPGEPAIKAILARYAESLTGFFQKDAPCLGTHTLRSADNSRIRAAYARKNDDQVFAWAAPPAGGHPGQDWNCRCTAEQTPDPQTVPDGAICDILTGDRLSADWPGVGRSELAPSHGPGRGHAVRRAVSARYPQNNAPKRQTPQIRHGGIAQETGSKYTEGPFDLRLSCTDFRLAAFQTRRAAALTHGKAVSPACPLTRTKVSCGIGGAVAGPPVRPGDALVSARERCRSSHPPARPCRSGSPRNAAPSAATSSGSAGAPPAAGWA